MEAAQSSKVKVTDHCTIRHNPTHKNTTSIRGTVPSIFRACEHGPAIVC